MNSTECGLASELITIEIEKVTVPERCQQIVTAMFDVRLLMVVEDLGMNSF